MPASRASGFPLRGVAAGDQPWTEDELALLRRVYPKRNGPARCRAALPHRTDQAIWFRASRLELNVHSRRWSEDDDRLLRRMWLEPTTLAGISSRLRRSQWAVYYRAKELELPLGVAPEMESVNAAARRTGYESDTLRQILAWAKVRVLPTRAPPRRRRTKVRHLMVDPIDVDEAIEKWLRTESIRAAAKRAGVDCESLRRRIHALGIEGRGQGRPIRVTEEQVAAALGRAA